MFIVTEKFLKDCSKSDNANLNEKQVEIVRSLGIEYSKGWVNRFVGKGISNETKEKLLKLKNYKKFNVLSDMNSSLTKTVESLKDAPGPEITWRMADFTKQLRITVKANKNIKRVEWQIDKPNQLLTANISTSCKTIKATWNYQTRTVFIYKDGQFKDEIPVENLSSVLGKMLAVKIVIKKKNT